MVFLLVLALLFPQTALDTHAQAHADHLAVTGVFTHSNLYPLSADFGGPCDVVGENLYRGSDPSRRWDLYAANPSHAAVLFGFRWTHHATGIAVSATGVVYAVDVFCVASG